jgi:hypothetical protein
VPYRAHKEKVRVAPEEEGLVADMVRQFADPYAFVRELVQNGIDAGATMLEVRARYTRDGIGIFSVRDDGSGMTRDIIEGPLLTLFNSAKDGDESKIGKYGVGFVSVFALALDDVVVETWTRGAKKSWLLRLYPDHAYELEEAKPPKGLSLSGTMVSVSGKMDESAFSGHARGVGVALSRWCRHAHIPLHWVVEREGVEGGTVRERADRPFELRTAVEVSHEVDGARYVVGPSAGAQFMREGAAGSFAGFYNRGLTLYETETAPAVHRLLHMHDETLDGVRFKVDSPLLQHTLSRDNVRHDSAYQYALINVYELAQDHLRDLLANKIDQVARVVAKLGETDVPYIALLAAACSDTPEVAPSQVTVPLTDPFLRSRVCSAAALESYNRILYAEKASRLTAAVSKQLQPVVLATHRLVPTLLATLLDVPTSLVQSVFLLVRERESKSRSEARLLIHVSRALDAVGQKPMSIAFASVVGQAPLRSAIAVAYEDTREHLIHADFHPRWRRRLGEVEPLLLLERHPAVKAARRMAKDDPGSAGELLARYMLVEDRAELSRGVADELLEASAARLRGGA